jgi:ABC-type transport system involved in multi-copper enzyme maturation permease subunit
MMTDSTLQPNAAPVAPEASQWRAWCYLVWLSWQRQLRERQMVLISLGLLLLVMIIVGIMTASHRWDMPRRHMPFYDPASNQAKADALQLAMWLSPFNQGFFPRETPLAAPGQFLLHQFSLGVRIFFNAVVDGVFISFLLPLLSMSFATHALGAERESNSFIWLLTRPIPRPLIYLGKFVAMLPWSLALNLGGFGLLCVVGGPQGRENFALTWPAVLSATLAYSSLFFFIGAFFRWPTVIAIVYSFFLEFILNMMPAYLKRASITFYTRCMMYDALQAHDIRPAQASNVFMPVDGVTACAVLVGATLFFLLLGMFWFGRKEYHEIS